MVNLSEYVKQTSESIGKSGGNPDAVYDSSISTAMIQCHNVAVEYANIRKIKNPPVPIAVVNKKSDDESYTQFKFSADNINTESLKKAISKVTGSENINIVEFNSTTNVEIYTN